MKKFLLLPSLITSFIFSFLIPNFTLAYVSLVPNSPLGGVSNSGDLKGFLVVIYNWGIGLAVALAILVIILGGVQYMTTDAVFGKEEGRKRVTAAVGGLLIALSSWLILNQINPQIFKNDLSLDSSAIPSATKINVSTSATTGTTGTTNTSNTGGNSVGNNSSDGKTSSAVTGDESSIRSSLSQNGISVNSNPCSYVGQTGCTNTSGLKQSTMDTLLAMKNSSGASNITLTGGTEGGGIHSEGSTYTHVNGYKFDVRPDNGKFDTYMRSLGSSTTINGNQVNIINEGNHWDVQVVPH